MKRSLFILLTLCSLLAFTVPLVYADDEPAPAPSDPPTPAPSDPPPTPPPADPPPAQ